MNRTWYLTRARLSLGSSLWAMALVGPAAIGLVGCASSPHSVPVSSATATSPSHPALPQRWMSGSLTITPTALGAVTVGMTIPQASAAAGQPLKSVGDGIFYPLGNASSGLSFMDVHGKVNCVGAASSGSKGHTVATPQGFVLGGSLAQLKAVYRSQLRFVPASATAIVPRPGYVVSFPDGNLVFWVSGGIVQGIGGGRGLMPSSEC